MIGAMIGQGAESYGYTALIMGTVFLAILYDILVHGLLAEEIPEDELLEHAMEQKKSSPLLANGPYPIFS